MKTEETKFVKNLIVFSKFSAWITIIIGLVVIVGWEFNISVLKSILPSFVSMKANTAFAFLLSGISLLLLQKKSENKTNQFVTQGISGIVFLIGLLTLVEYVFQFNFGIDQFLFKEDVGAVYTPSPGRMSANTAICLSLVGLSLLLYSKRIRKNILPVQVLSLFVLMIALIGIFGYVYSQWGILLVMNSTLMALHTAFLFFMLSIGILVSKPNEGLMKSLTSESSGGKVLRYLIPSVILFPLVVELITKSGISLGLFDVNLEHVFHALIVIVILCILSWLATAQYERADKEVKQSDARFRSVFENSPLGKSMTGIDGSLKVNKSFFDILGYTEEELKIKKWQEITYSDDVEESAAIVQSLIKGERSRANYEKRYIHKNGNIVWTDVNITLQRDKNNNPLYFITVINDITGRKQAEEKLRESQEKYSHLYETAPVGIYRTKIDGSKILEINDTACKMLGFTKEEMLNQSSAIRWADPNRRGEILKILKEHGVATNFDADIFKKDNSIISCLLTMNIYKEEEYIEGFIVDISERKQAEETLRQSRKELDNLFEASSEMISFIGFDGYFKRLNPAWVKTLGYPMDKLLSIPFIEFVHPDDRETTKAEASKLAEGQRTIRFDNRYRCNDGSFRWLSWSVIPDTNEKLFYAVARDITERKISEDKLRFQSEIMNNMTEAVYLIRMKDGVIVYTNSQFEEMFGYSQNEMLGKNVAIVNAPTEKDPETTVREIMSVLAEKVVWEGEVNNIRKDRTTFWCYAKVSVFEHSQFGRVLISVHRDITERKQMEEKLREQSDAMEAAIDGLAILNAEQNYVYMNKSHAGIYGYDYASELIGASWRILYDTEELQRFAQEILPELNLKGHYQGRALGKKKDGTTFPQTLSLTALENGGLICTVRDITELKHEEQELIVAKEKSEESDRLKTAFLLNMSHEIRTPMNGILGFAELLKMPGISNDEQQEYIGFIKKSSDRMLTIINDLVDISKIESGLVKIDHDQSNINEQTEFVYTSFKLQAEERGLNLSYRNGIPDGEAIITTDKTKVDSILSNLVKNAIKFTDKGTIEFGYTLKPFIQSLSHDVVQPSGHEAVTDVLEFYIKDTGIGIPVDRQQAIFERFIQADIEDKRAFQGAGLGLSIAKGYVEMLGGKLWVESEEGKGSTFRFTIPYLPVQKVKTADSTHASPGVATEQIKKLKILVVEDDDTSVILLMLMFKEYSRETLIADTGTEAIETCRSNPDIDLVLMDIKMSGMDGYEATRQIRQFNKDVVIIAQTAFTRKGDREKALEVGCNDYISKPITKDRLMYLIEKYFMKTNMTKSANFDTQADDIILSWNI